MPGVWLRLADEVLGRRCKRVGSRIRRGPEPHLEAAGVAHAAHRRRRCTRCPPPRSAQPPLQRLRRSASTVEPVPQPLLERRRARRTSAGVGGGGEGRAVEAREGDGVLDARACPAMISHRRAHHRVGALQRGAARQLQRRRSDALVLRRDEAASAGAADASRSAPISTDIDTSSSARARAMPAPHQVAA